MIKFKDLCAISGLSGLYQLISTKSDGAIVKSLDDNITKFVAARSHNVTPLNSIEVYTNEDNIRLFEVFKTFEQNESNLDSMEVASKNNKEIEVMFGKLFPSYDKQKVYISDMKKMIKWYGIVKKLDLLNEEEIAQETETTE